MFNPLPILALGAVALGYAGAIDRAEQKFESHDQTSVAAFPASPKLSVHDFVSKLPVTVQDPYCDTVDMIAASLTDDFAESRTDAWIQGADLKMELWTSDLMGSWTLLHVGVDGISCIVSSGFGWTDGMEVQDVLAAAPLSS